jgi:hypothetical protein
MNDSIFEETYKYEKKENILKNFGINFSYFIEYGIKDKINNENNLLVIFDKTNLAFEIYFIVYYNWFPHIKCFIENNFCNNNHDGFFQIIQKIKKINDLDRKWDIYKHRKWDIFRHNSEKIDLNFDDFILEFLLNNKKIGNVIKNNLVAKENQKLFQCDKCKKNKKQYLNNYLICKEGYLCYLFYYCK